jgi:hypothetical protein
MDLIVVFVLFIIFGFLVVNYLSNESNYSNKEGYNDNSTTNNFISEYRWLVVVGVVNENTTNNFIAYIPFIRCP